MPFEPRPLAQFQTAFLAATTSVQAPEHPGLRVHHDTRLLGLMACLEDIYPAVAAGLGCGFKAYARDYVQAHPQTTGDRAAYGAGFGDFLQAHPHLGELTWLPDLARYEHALHQAEIAEDAVACTFEALLDPDMRVGLHPSVVRLQLRYDVAAARDANLSGAAPDIVPASNRLLIGRTPADEVVRLDLSPDDAAFLDALVRDQSLFSLIANLMPTPQTLAQWQDLLARLVHHGLLVTFKGTHP